MNDEPVIAGASAVTQHTSEADHGVDAIGLMVRACQNAVPGALLERAGLVVIPRGTWRYPDPGRLVADAIGAHRARTVLAEIGVLQTSVVAYAIEAVATRQCEVAIVAGGEALDRRKVARRGGFRVAEPTQAPDARPDIVLRPRADIRGVDEERWGLREPYVQYALMDSARRHRLGHTVTESKQQIADLWSAFSATASLNPSAWERRIWSAAELMDTEMPRNRSLATPYSAKFATQMHVDQASAIVVCSRDAAQRAGIPAKDWVYPALVVESDLAVPLVERADVTRCPQWSLIADALRTALSGPIDAVDLIDLYSCFPVAVNHQRDAFGLGHRLDVTITGGMTFGGGPLNNAALQAIARAVELIQAGAPETALVTAVSGYLTKQGALLLQADEPDASFGHADVTFGARRLVTQRPTVAAFSGPGEIEAFTVVSHRDGPSEVVAIVRVAGGAGTVGRSDDPQLVASVGGEDWVGHTVDLHEGALLSIGGSSTAERIVAGDAR